MAFRRSKGSKNFVNRSLFIKVFNNYRNLRPKGQKMERKNLSVLFLSITFAGQSSLTSASMWLDPANTNTIK